MILSYDSILGIPTIERDDRRVNSSNTGFMLNTWSVVLFVVILVLFVIVLANLGTTETNTPITSTNDTTTMTILLGGVLMVVILLNGLQYFYNMNLTAVLSNLFTVNPSLDITIDQVATSAEFAPIPEITTKPQVYHIPGNNYTYDNAEAICQAYGSRLATYNELEDAYDNGAEWCSYGWSDKQMGLFPTQKKTWDHLQTVEGHEHDCGRPGINGGYIANKNVRFGVNCFGYKPKITDEEKQMMDTAPLYPKTLKDIEQEKRVDYWKRKIPEILVSPFNKDVWSLI